MGALAAASLAASCGDNSAVCGEGTVAVDGVCVPEDEVGCGPGTTEVGGECVPDGSVLCEQGTVFDEESGTCVVDPSACAEGTVLVEGVCIPEDEALTADHEEIAEPNDGVLETDDVAGQFDLPVIGESTSVHGCINPYRDLDDNGNPDPDLDLWIFQTGGPALIEMTADGVGGLSAGFQLIAGTGEDVVDDNFVRFGINLTGDTSSRQVYLPVGGVYAFFMADSRSLFLQDGAAGSPVACYFTTITNVAIPAPTPATVNTEVMGTHDGNVDFYSADPADGSFFIGVHDMPAPSAFTSLFVIRNDVPFEYGEPDPTAGIPAVVRTGGLFNTDELIYVIDPIYNYALAPVDYTFEVFAPPQGPIPTGGSSIVIDNLETGDDFVGWFDVGANEMDHFLTSADSAVTLTFIDEHGFLVASGASSTAFNNWIKFPAAGRYHVVINRATTTPAQINFTSEITASPITPITIGTLIDNAPFNVPEATWHSFDPGTNIWLSFNVPAAAGWGSELRIDAYNLTGVGIPGTNFASLQNLTLNADGTETLGRIAYNDPLDYLIRITDPSSTATTGSTYDLDIDLRDFTDLGTVTEAAPVDETALDLGTFSGRFFFVRASRGGAVTITVTPSGFDASIQILGPTENVVATQNSGLIGVAEVHTRTLTTTDWVAFRVNNIVGVGGTFDLDITIDNPLYTTTSSNLVYADACATGSVIPMTATSIYPPEDEGVTAAQTPPAGFEYFGQAVTSYQVSSNGFLSFETVTGTSFTHSAIGGSGAPNGFIAPLWVDMDQTQVCISGAGTNVVTVQWEGIGFSFPNPPVRMQARLHSDGQIDLIYAAGHISTGNPGTVGFENLTGQTPHANFGFNEAGSTVAGASWIATPE